MDAARIIAGILGPLFVIQGIGILLNTARYRQLAEEFISTPALVYLRGMFVLVTGLLILSFHHAWSADWRVVVTIIGWMTLIPGALCLVAPAVLGLWKPLVARSSTLRFSGLGALALGLFLSAAAYANV